MGIKENEDSAVRGRNEKRKREKKEKSLGSGVREQKWHQVERKRKQKKIEKRAEGEKGGRVDVYEKRARTKENEELKSTRRKCVRS